MAKSVFIHSGPAGSGKTTQMMDYAKENGIYWALVPWQILEKSERSFWKYLQKDAKGKYHLFIDEYDVNNHAANWYLDYIAQQGVIILAATQVQVSASDRQKLPASFYVIKCEAPFIAREVSHG